MVWVADVLDDPEFAQQRADRRHNWAEVVRVLARYADWRNDYNTYRPHSALGMLTPTEFARQWRTHHQPKLS